MDQTKRWCVLLLLLFPIGCGDDTEDANNDNSKSTENENRSDSDDSDSTVSETPIDHCASPVGQFDEAGTYVVIAQDRFNYSFQSSLEIQTVNVKSLSNLTFDWSSITTDMLGHTFDPMSSVDMVEMMLWRYDETALIEDINSDNLDTSQLVTLGVIHTENALSTGQFLDLHSPSGGEVDEEELLEYVDTTLYPPEDHTYFVMVAEGNVFGHGTKMISFIEPSPDETNTEVVLTNDSTKLNYTADLTSLTRITVPPGTADIELDWIDNTILLANAMGQEWIPTKITDVLVAHYIDKTPEDLEQDFLNIELIADEIWSIFLSAGQSINLSKLNTESDYSGEFFQGIDDVGTWIVALKCDTCANPAPWFLSILHPCPSLQ